MNSKRCMSPYQLTFTRRLPSQNKKCLIYPESETFLCLCLLNEHREHIRTLIFHFGWRGLGALVLPWNCHRGHNMELCDACNCTKFQFYTKKRLHRYSTFWCHKSSKLHKSVSWISRQPRVLSQWNKHHSSFWTLFGISQLKIVSYT